MKIFSIPGLITLLLVIFKLTGVITMSWWWVLFFVWIGPAIVLAATAAAIALSFVIAIIGASILGVLFLWSLVDD